MTQEHIYIKFHVLASLQYKNVTMKSGPSSLDIFIVVITQSMQVMEIIMTKQGKQLEAALTVASQIGYVIPEYFTQVLESAENAGALVEKLVDTLNSNRQITCCGSPRKRRVLIEVLISIVDFCPRYINIFREKRVTDALDMVKPHLDWKNTGSSLMVKEWSRRTYRCVT